jgi:TalC/MipB family fructose-6-phosphate aldolase
LVKCPLVVNGGEGESMAVFVDTAVIADIAEISAAYPIAGVTTNPSILLAALEKGQRLSDTEVLRRLLEVCAGPVFMQPVGDSPDALYKAALVYGAADPERVVVKLPATSTGLQAGRDLSRDGIQFALTAVASVAQAYLGALAGARWVIPYFCRLRQSGVDVSQVISDMSHLLEGQKTMTRILAASLKPRTTSLKPRWPAHMTLPPRQASSKPCRDTP